MGSPSLLAIFDFDNSITEEDTDQHLLMKLAPELYKNYVLPGYKQRIPTSTIMDSAYEKLHLDYNISATTIRAAVSTCSIPSSMAQLLRALQENANVEAGIVSDANSVHIHEVLTAHGVDANACFGNAGIFTNKAWVEGSRLRVKAAMKEGGHSCETCPKNICKEPLVKEMLVSVKAKDVIYIGDGGNDFCGAKVLPEGATVFPRKGYSLDRILSSTKIKANVVPWASHAELAELIKVKIP